MKKNLLLIAVVAMASATLFNACKKKEEAPAPVKKEQGIVVAEVNTGIIHKFTGTNCYYCGDWGWPMFEELISTHHGVDAVCIGSYSQNSFAKLLINPFATAMDKRLPVTKGYPTFAGNFFDAWTGTQTLQGMKDNIKTKIDAHKAAAVFANSGLSFTDDGSNLVVKTKTKFFQAGNGEYNISVMVLEDDVVANQAGPNGGPNAKHHKVLRASNGDWGVNVTTGDVAAGAEFDNEISLVKDPAWNMSNVELISVIWKKNGTKWDFVNAHLHKN